MSREDKQKRPLLQSFGCRGIQYRKMSPQVYKYECLTKCVYAPGGRTHFLSHKNGVRMNYLATVISFMFVNILAHAFHITAEHEEKSFGGYQVFRIETNSTQALEFLGKLYLSSAEVFDFWSGPSPHSPIDIAVNEDQAEYLLTSLEALDVTPKILIADLGEKIRNAEKDSIRQEAPMSWTAYHKLDSIYTWLESLESQYPNLVTLEEIGQSFQNRPLKLVRISTSNSTVNSSKPAIWLDGGIHAREWVSPATVTYVISQLLNETETPENSKFSSGNKLVDLFDWYILPVVNPDGYEYSWTNSRMWRKTRSDYRSQALSSSSYDGRRPKSIWDNLVGFCAGVDANRNFDVQWGGKGTSGNPCSEIYRGRKPASEPEVAAVQKFILRNNEGIKLFLSIHSYSQMILIPWAYDDVEPADFPELKAVAVKAAAAIQAVHGTVYRPGQTTKLLGAAAGSSKDWAKKVAGIKYSFGFELRDTGKDGFILPAEQIIPTAQETYAGIKSMAEDIAGIYNVTPAYEGNGTQYTV
ncbi:unnamed protein product [Allacma fusca]|uniref:Peptidase M14 domain-containing protein n=1 Tax=Allacma fusca TaxID=39272 RepID=A0A8J2JQS0_9HEXA|nr:unnamed protein product [Allacma fusca]